MTWANRVAEAIDPRPRASGNAGSRPARTTACTPCGPIIMSGDTTRMAVSNASISPAEVVAIAVLGVLIAVGCSGRSHPESAEPVVLQTDLKRYPHFVFAKIMDPVMPIERGTKYEDPLADTLEGRKLGEVTGGGTQMDKDKKIEWVGIDIQLADLVGAVELVRQRLRELGAPAGSVLEFKRGDQQVSLPIH
jgi:hypothetical protein